MAGEGRLRGAGVMEEIGSGEGGLREEVKLEHVPRLKCSEAVREGLEEEKRESQREHLSFTDLGRPVSGWGTRMGSRWAQYQAPLPFMAFVRTVRRPSKRLLMARRAPASEEKGRGSVEVEVVVEVIAWSWRVRTGWWWGEEEVVTVVSPFWWEWVSFWGI